MRIGILTSGGDCPGINAAIRGVCKTAINHYGMETIGIHSGFLGLLTKEVTPITEGDLTGLLNLGGTILGIPGAIVGAFLGGFVGCVRSILDDIF